MIRPRKLKFGTVVRVIWEDSATGNGWTYQNPKVVGQTTKVVSIGYVVNSKLEAPNTFLTLTTSIDAVGGMLSPVSIPWSAVQEIDVLDKQLYKRPDED